jgi:hypothetical protein
MKVGTKVCCPDLHYVTKDTTVCDTLMPFTWHGLLFDAPGSQTTIEKDERGCDTLQTTWTLGTKVCCPDLHYATRDTTVCDTLMPFTWHGLLFEESGSQTTIEKDERGCDTLQTTWTLGTEVCCPDLHYVTRDTTVCDTLMPFVWLIEGYEVTFSDIGTEYLSVPHPKWTNCIAAEYTLRLDTFHCERLYLLIVNKYNWQLLLDNVSFARFFPGRTARAYQWYKNDAPIPGATDDDYAEQNELQGRFQLRIELDGDQTIWSNILEIGEVQTETE